MVINYKYIYNKSISHIFKFVFKNCNKINFCTCNILYFDFCKIKNDISLN